MHPGVGVTSTLGGGVGRVITIENLTPTRFPPSLFPLFHIPQTSHLPHAAWAVPRTSHALAPCRSGSTHDADAAPVRGVDQALLEQGRGGRSTLLLPARRRCPARLSRLVSPPGLNPLVTTRVAPASARMVHPRPRLRAARQVIPSHPIPGKVLDPSMSQHFSSTRPAPGDAWHALDRARWNGGGDGSLRSAYHVWSCNDLHTPGC